VRRRSGRACGLFACRRAVIGLPTSHPSLSYPHSEHCSDSLFGSKCRRIRCPFSPHQKRATCRAKAEKILATTCEMAVSCRRVLLIPKTLSMTMAMLPPLLKQGMGRFSPAVNERCTVKFRDLEAPTDQKTGGLVRKPNRSMRRSITQRIDEIDAGRVETLHAVRALGPLGDGADQAQQLVDAVFQ
jgi:hypothetical protein